MFRGDRDYVAIALATAGVLAALSLAGIFIVYLVDTIGGDDKPANAQVAGATIQTTPAPAPTVPSPGASAPTSPAPPTDAARAGQKRQNRIPDDQQYETFTSSSAGWSISHPKGWSERGSDENRTWTFGLDGLHVVVGRGQRPTVGLLRDFIAKQKKLKIVSPPQKVEVNGQPAIKATVQQRRRQPDGRKARIYIDQYRMELKGRTIAIDISCPFGVYKPNSDDFKRMVDSFRRK